MGKLLVLWGESWHWSPHELRVIASFRLRKKGYASFNEECPWCKSKNDRFLPNLYPCMHVFLICCVKKWERHDWYFWQPTFISEVEVLVAQLCLILSDPMDCSPPGSSAHRAFQARILELPFPSPGDLPNQGSNPDLLHCRQILYHLSYQGSSLVIVQESSCVIVWGVSWTSCFFSHGTPP